MTLDDVINHLLDLASPILHKRLGKPIESLPIPANFNGPDDPESPKYHKPRNKARQSAKSGKRAVKRPKVDASTINDLL